MSKLRFRGMLLYSVTYYECIGYFPLFSVPSMIRDEVCSRHCSIRSWCLRSAYVTWSYGPHSYAIHIATLHKKRQSNTLQIAMAMQREQRFYLEGHVSRPF